MRDKQLARAAIICAFLMFTLVTLSFLPAPQVVKAESANPVTSNIESQNGSGSNSISANQQLQLIDVASGGVPPYTYQWYIREDKISGATSSNFTFVESTPGLYAVACEVTDSQGNTGGGLSELPLFVTVTATNAPSPTLSPSPAPSASATPTITVGPTSSPSPPNFIALPYFIVGVLVVVIAISVIFIFRRKHSVMT